MIGFAGLKLEFFKPKLVDPSYFIPFLGRPSKPPQEVVLVLLDEDSHRELNQPYNASWDRALFAQLLQRLTAEHARAVVFDMLFTDRHPTKPEGDAAFANAIRENGKVILGADYALTADGAPTMHRPIDLFLDASADWGFVQVQAEEDFMVRRHMHVPPNPDADNFSSMSWLTYQFVSPPGSVKPEDRLLQRWFNYYGPRGTIPEISFRTALQPGEACPSGYFSNKVVFVGGGIQTHFSGERKDEYLTPYGERKSRNYKGGFVPGVEVQATEFLNLLRRDWLTRLSSSAEFCITIFCGLAFGAGLAHFRPMPATGIALAGCGLITFTAYYLFWERLIWFPWMVIVAAQIPVALFWSILHNSVHSYIQNRLLQQSLALYLSPKQVERILKDPSMRQPGGSKQVISILFSDIAGFSLISEQLDPTDLVLLLNKYYETTIRCIHQTEGTVVDIIGDAIFAIWNAPEAQPDHREKMLQAAVLFQENVKHFNGRELAFPLRTRVGLHTGEVVVGNVGSSEHFDFTAIGENVNLASRLEGLNKQLGTDILLTRAAIPEAQSAWALRPLGKFQFKGFANVVEVIELLVSAGATETTKPWMELFATGMAHFQNKEFVLAKECFNQTLVLRPHDGPSTFYLKQIEDLSSHTLPANWSGEIALKEK